MRKSVRVQSKYSRFCWTKDPPKDPYFVSAITLSKFHLSTLTFERFKADFSRYGWNFELTNRFVNSTNVLYMNFHRVSVPTTALYREFEFYIGFGMLNLNTLDLIFKHYPRKHVLFFHKSLCDDLTPLQIYDEIFNFRDDENFDSTTQKLCLLFEPQSIYLYRSYGGKRWFDVDKLPEERVFNFRYNQRRGSRRGLSLKSNKFVSKGQVLVDA